MGKNINIKPLASCTRVAVCAEHRLLLLLDTFIDLPRYNTASTTVEL